jgi:hypothetical protein
MFWETDQGGWSLVKGSSYSPSDHCQCKSGIESKKQQLTKSKATDCGKSKHKCREKVLEAAQTLQSGLPWSNRARFRVFAMRERHRLRAFILLVHDPNRVWLTTGELDIDVENGFAAILLVVELRALGNVRTMEERWDLEGKRS